MKDLGKSQVFRGLLKDWTGDYYYAVGYSDKHNCIGSFRVDRIVNRPHVLDEHAHPVPTNFDINTYLNSMFHMSGGELEEVELVCDNSIMDSIIDKFGKDVTILANDMSSFRVIANIATGRAFYGWVLGLQEWSEAKLLNG